MPGVRTLLLLRHAKSDWSDPGLDDHDRPLAPRGLRATARIGGYLERRGARPRLVLSSSSLRTVDTARRVTSAWDARIRPERDLYLADAERMLARIRACPDDADPLMVVGHFPGIHDLARRLRRPPGDGAEDPLAGKFPTGGLAVLGFAAGRWAGIEPGTGVLEAFVRPRDLAGDGRGAA